MTTPLPPQDPGTPDEQQPGEAALAALYRQLPQSEPGPALDAAVLRAAAQALAPDEESPTVLRERRRAARERGDWVHPKAPSTPAAASPIAGNRQRPRWLLALSSAATLVLAAGLVWHMRGLPSPEPASTAAHNVTPAAATAAAPAPRVAPPSAAPLAEAVPSPPPPEPPRQPPPRIAVAQLHAPAAMRKAAADQSVERASSAGYVAGPVQPEPVAAPAPLQESAGNSAAKTTPPALSAAAPVAAMAPAPAPVEEVATDMATAPNAADTPAQELDKIRQLLAQHQDDEARQRLEAFHRLHPSWDLPPELRARLRQP